MGRTRNGCAFFELENYEVNLRDRPMSKVLKLRPELSQESPLRRSAMFIEPGVVIGALRRSAMWWCKEMVLGFTSVA